MDTVPAIIIVEKIYNYLRETVVTTVITPQYTVQMVVTNRKLPIRRYYDPTIIMAGTVAIRFIVCSDSLLVSTLVAQILFCTLNCLKLRLYIAH